MTRMQLFNATGQPLAAGCVNFFAAGTSTPQAIYADSAGLFQLPNPLTLDAAGSADVWVTNNAYRIVTNTGTPGQLCSVSLGTQLNVTDNKNIYAIINQGGNFVVANAASDPSGVPGELGYRTDIPCLRIFTSIWDCVVTQVGTQTLTNKTIDISLNTLENSTNTAGHYERNNGTQYVDSTLVASDAQSTYINEGVTGTFVNRLAQLVGVGAVNFPGTTITSGVIGICVSGCGTTGNSQIASSGLLSCQFDGATTANDYVQISSTSAGFCHDSGIASPNFPANGNQVLGRVIETHIGSGLYQMIFGPEARAPGAPPAIPSINSTGLNANVPLTPLVTPALNGFYRASCYVVVTTAALTTSTLPSCQVNWTDADSSIAFNVALTAVNSANTVGSSSLTPAVNAPFAYFFAKTGVQISYQTINYASNPANAMTYALHLRLEGPF